MGRGRPARTWSPILSLLVVALFLLVGAAVYATRAGKTADAEGPTVAGATQPVGTPLRNGFSVAPGSLLLGVLFPVVEDADSIAEAGSGAIVSWRAQLLLTGDPIETFNRYLAQAQTAGYPVFGGCTASSDGGQGVSLEDFDEGSAVLLECRAGFQRSSRPNKSSTYIAIRVEQGLRDGVVVSAVGLRYVQIGDGTGETQSYGPLAGPLTQIRAAVPSLPSAPELTFVGPGDRLLPGEGDVDFVLPPGVQQVGAASGSVVCSGGWEVVLSANGSAAASLRDFQDQMISGGYPPPFILTERDPDADVATLHHRSMGGNNGVIVSAADAGDDHYLMVTLC